jgi:hypothetical protein
MPPVSQESKAGSLLFFCVKRFPPRLVSLRADAQGPAALPTSRRCDRWRNPHPSIARGRRSCPAPRPQQGEAVVRSGPPWRGCPPVLGSALPAVCQYPLDPRSSWAGGARSMRVSRRRPAAATWSRRLVRTSTARTPASRWPDPGCSIPQSSRQMRRERALHWEAPSAALLLLFTCLGC